MNPDSEVTEYPAQIRAATDEFVAKLSAVHAEQVKAISSQIQSAVLDTLNQAVRRMRRASSTQQWALALRDGAAAVSESAQVLLVGTDALYPVGTSDRLPLHDVPALASVISTSDTTIALPNEAEVSPYLFAKLGQPVDGKIYIVPVSRAGETAALILGTTHLTALELLASAAGDNVAAAPEPVFREAEEEDRGHRDFIQINGISGAPRLAEPPPVPPVNEIRAHNFARVQIARLLLEHSSEVAQGRANRDLYSALRDAIETGRSEYRHKYMSAQPLSADYYHLELLKTLAHEDESLLGSNYPGPLL